MGLGASTHAKMATAENPLDGLARGTADLAHFDEHLAKAIAKLAELRAAFAWPHPPGCDDERGADVAALPLERMAEMLSAGDLALEQGYVRCDDGTYFAASRARMPNVTGAMLQWWFTWCDVGYKYILWHPEVRRRHRTICDLFDRRVRARCTEGFRAMPPRGRRLRR